MTDKPVHYKVICISMYTRDIERLNDKVKELRRRGMTKMSKSELIRIALGMLDLDAVVAPLKSWERDAPSPEGQP